MHENIISYWQGTIFLKSQLFVIFFVQHYFYRPKDFKWLLNKDRIVILYIFVEMI